MRRHAAALVFLLACEPQLVPTPLPPLAVARAPVAIDVGTLGLHPGEAMIWDVALRGMTIGRAELVVGDTDVRSRFKTGGLASAFASARHEMVTRLDRAAERPSSGSETLVVDGETRRVEVVFEGSSVVVGGRAVAVPGGGRAHTLHTALGALRAWADPGAAPGYLYVVQLGRLFRLDVAQPMAEDFQGRRTLRIDGHIRADDADPISITLWLTADPTRAPVRIEIRTAAAQLTAELVSA
jgi:hypothetical protein